MTSNIGSNLILEYTEKDYSEMTMKIEELLRISFKPEFLNRIDETIVFHNLDKAQIREIVEIQLKDLKTRLENRNIQIAFEPGALDFIADKGYSHDFGARPLKRAIQKYIENELSLEILKGRIAEGSKLLVKEENGSIVFIVDEK